MDRPLRNLISVLTQQASVASKEMAAKPEDNRAAWAAISPSTVAPVVAAMREIPSLNQLEGRMYVLPRESGVINLESAAIYLLDRAQKFAPEAIAQDLLRLSEQRAVELVETRLIGGIRPTREIKLKDGFSVVPPSLTPLHDFAPQLFSDSNQPRHGFGTPPTAAIVRRRKYDLQICDRPTSPILPPTPAKDITSDRDWQAALDACALASDAAPQFRQTFDAVEDLGWLGMRTNGLGGSESFPVPEIHATFFVEDKVPLLFDQRRTENKTIDLAVKSLISSRRRLTPEERALDLGTCIELLLMSGSKDNAEISYKIRTRAAWLIGHDADDRLAVFKAARDLYGDRSKATHTGSLGTPKNMEETMAQIERLRDSDRLCVRIISKVLERGVPNSSQWESIVLGASDY